MRTLYLSIILFLFVSKSAEIEQSSLEEKLVIRNGSQAFEKFASKSANHRFSIYIFNMTNLESFDGKSVQSLKFREVGPYVVQYNEHKSYEFNRQLTNTNLNSQDKVLIVNPMLANLPQNGTIGLSDSVERIAFKGIDRMKGYALFKETYTGKSHIGQIGQYLRYSSNVTGKTSFWRPESTCNDLKGTDDTRFHTDIKPDESLWLFEPLLCRSLKFVSDSANSIGQMFNLSTLRFYASEDNLIASLENQCFCSNNQTDQCQADAQSLRSYPPHSENHRDLIASSPFYQLNPGFWTETGLSPITMENFGTYLEVEPKTGIVLSSRKRIQFNVQLTRGSHHLLDNLKKNKLIAPLLYVDEAYVISYADVMRIKSWITQMH